MGRTMGLVRDQRDVRYGETLLPFIVDVLSCTPELSRRLQSWDVDRNHPTRCRRDDDATTGL